MHTKDGDCTVVDGTCTGCGVVHGEACDLCGGRGFHVGGCVATFDVMVESDAGGSLRATARGRVVTLAIEDGARTALLHLTPDDVVTLLRRLERFRRDVVDAVPR